MILYIIAFEGVNTFDSGRREDSVLRALVKGGVGIMARTIYSVEFHDWIPQKEKVFFLKRDDHGNFDITNDPQEAELFNSPEVAIKELQRLRSLELLRSFSNKTLIDMAVLFHLALCPFVRRRLIPRL